MKVIQCEMCGSRDLLKQDGVFVCQSCGTKYSVEEAKKMMVEGTVQVTGTVKVDKSEELKNLYILAERARKSNNSDNAVRYYNQIIEKDPNSWQANFYLIYFKAKNTNVGSIPGVCYDLINCYQSTFELLIEEKGDDITAELKMLIDDIYDYSNAIVNSTWRMQDDYKYQGHALEILSKFGDKLIEIYGETYQEATLISYKKSMQVYQNILGYCENRNIADATARLISGFYSIEELQRKLKKYSSKDKDIQNNGTLTEDEHIATNNNTTQNYSTKGNFGQRKEQEVKLEKLWKKIAWSVFFAGVILLALFFTLESIFPAIEYSDISVVVIILGSLMMGLGLIVGILLALGIS